VTSTRQTTPTEATAPSTLLTADASSAPATIEARKSQGTAERRSAGGAPELAVMAALALVSVLNYAYTAVLVWLLPPRQYALVGAASSLLLVCGTVAAASVPWVLAREVAKARDDQSRRQAAVSFCIFGTLVEAAAAGIVTGTIAAAYGNSAVIAVVVGSAVAIFTSATTCGYLQGYERFGMIAALKLGEVVIKVIAGVILVAAGAGAAGAIVGFAIGSGIVTVIGVTIMRPDLRVMRSSLTDRGLWSAAGGLMAIQGGVAILASLDVIVGSLVIGDRARLATYEVAQILTRIPVFIGSAMSIIVFPRLVTRDRDAQAVAIGDNLGLWLRLCVPLAIVTGTLPGSIVGRLFPASYGHVTSVLALTAVAGLFMGAVNLVSTYFQATDVYRRPCQVLGVAAVALAAGAVVGIHLGGIEGLAGAAATVSAAVTVAFLLLCRPRWPHATRRLWRSAAVPLVAGAPLVLLRTHLVAWLVWATIALGLPVLVTLLRFRQTAGGEHRTRVLHLGFEDPARPGAGGGSVRTHEINRRLADRFDITVVCARYPGCESRVTDGVRYVHVGLGLGYAPSLLAYFAALPLALVRWDSDLVVEDFAAPFSSVAVPWMTRRPVVGVVQWLFAREKATQYRVPFHLVERVGVRSHRHLVAVSADLGADLAARNPAARVTVVPNGLPDEAFFPRAAPRRHAVYLGRLESAQKGLDLLLQAWAAVPESDDELVVAGDGPDEDALRILARELGIEHRVRFIGRVAAEDRFDLLASAKVVVMPSRYETFGMVAAESLAVATPVVAFAIPCLRGLVDASTGILVNAFDTAALAGAVGALLDDPDLARRLGEAGAESVAGLRWDLVAEQQADVYDRLRHGAGPEPVPALHRRTELRLDRRDRPPRLRQRRYGYEPRHRARR
jgi:glycosyltransferase involved in cell wall biosynthesis/O-antigen/teichoic acid export membrane protein